MTPLGRLAGNWPETGHGRPMIKLYQYPSTFGMNVSPFTAKLETWLKLSPSRLPDRRDAQSRQSAQGQASLYRRRRRHADRRQQPDHRPSEAHPRDRSRPRAVRAPARRSDLPAAPVRTSFLLHSGLQPLDRSGRLGCGASGVLRLPAAGRSRSCRRPDPSSGETVVA